MTRQQRERAILEIVRSRPVTTQGELVRALRQLGLRVTQATVSRDIKRLGLVKVAGPDGTYHYAPPDALRTTPPPAARENLRGAFRAFVTEVDQGDAIVLVKTLSGRANAVAIALDEARIPEISGTVAGDDTILVVVRRAADRPKMVQLLRALLDRT
ncbi:MAG: arginine repressor [Armatimonadota bacterium]|nr:arginine repressor [Armatimonadota bacterium]MDR7439772.1 arginine repressor [Armatimonadota bacterium]MDR7562267.1 arginine repressor [Armatimonadota bacterium]MDR7568326.1 arginine repressor [Armatimonadota bacterium]MDR7602670.1 arginine repressor [Armatimonadota bacterium]